MKNKKIIYILIPALIAVWGIIGTKIFTYLKSDGSSDSQIKTKKIFEPEKNIKDTFDLIADYPDPFLQATSKHLHKKKPLSKTNTKNMPKKNIKWPKVEYRGMVTNQTNKKTVINISINSKNYLMSEGQEKNNIQLIKIYEDSIITCYQNENKTFYNK